MPPDARGGWLIGFVRGFHLSGWSDPLHDAGLGWSLLVFTGGLLALLRRAGAAWRHHPVSNPNVLQIFRFAAVLGALGGFTAFLRHPAGSYGRSDLVAGGGSALPWVLTLLLERSRRLLEKGRPWS